MTVDPSRPSLDSLAAAIETALVTARVALKEYARGRRERGSVDAVIRVTDPGVAEAPRGRCPPEATA